MSEQNEQPEIYVGEKPLGNYVKAVKYRLNELTEATVVARGNFIRKAVDASEIVKREENVKILDIKTDTEEGENPDGESFMTSKIEIDLEGEVELETKKEE